MSRPGFRGDVKPRIAHCDQTCPWGALTDAICPFRHWMRCPRSPRQLSASVQRLAGTREGVQRTSDRVRSAECDHYDADPRHGLATLVGSPLAAVSAGIEEHCPNESGRIAAKVYGVSKAGIEPSGRVTLFRAAPGTHPRTR